MPKNVCFLDRVDWVQITFARNGIVRQKRLSIGNASIEPVSLSLFRVVAIHSEKFGQLFNTKVYKSSEINIARGRRKKKKNTVGERISTDCWQAAHSYFGLASLTFLKKLFAAKLHLTLSEKYETCIARSRFV